MGQHNQHHFRDFSKWFLVSPVQRPNDARLIAAGAPFAGRYGLTKAEITRETAL